MRYSHRSPVRVIAIAAPVQQQRKVNVLYALSAGILTTIGVYALASLLG